MEKNSSTQYIDRLILKQICTLIQLLFFSRFIYSPLFVFFCSFLLFCFFFHS